jgi:hypothetical protein
MMAGMQLTAAEFLKFEVLAEGMSVDAAALRYITEANGGRALTPADYASTSGLILRLDGEVWVNAPIAQHNPNFVDQPSVTLTVGEDGLALHGRGHSSAAAYWLTPRYHDETNRNGEPHTVFAFTHGDRVRISPIGGCAFTCRFCNLPYEFRYRRKEMDALLEAVEAARTDPVQPAHHILISGGTPKPADYAYLREVYETVITRCAPMPVDIMMVPIAEVLDVPRLADLGVDQLSINLEVFDEATARRLMPRKAGLGRDTLLRFAEYAATVLGPGRVRSMILVGLEPAEETLSGVRAILDAGCVPVLSPFRPDPATPLRDYRPPSAADMREIYESARALCQAAGVRLGPDCRPCTHNTLALSTTSSAGDSVMCHGQPITV